ncbi:MAG: cell division protein FtsZ [Alphaproteobacteria bacterium]|nr:cell division protein FtsZ [Alphaproteobacteria bacterium]MBV9371500.1 cell division protein FtsZ [Alphaproteobacteria bacterium]MBV9902758.1 cell division protein FtsZ [Alphaproteobacteria bacterium]
MSSADLQVLPLNPRITVIGTGGAGNNALSLMVENGLQGVELVAANTDAQTLRRSALPDILQLGRRTTEGLGAGSRAEIGRKAAEESRGDIERRLQGSDMCFIAAGMGGGTGTGAAPVIAEIARSMGVLTVAVVTKPFAFEGARRARAAEAGVEALAPHVDSLIVIPNQNLFRLVSPTTTLKAAFALADDILYQGVRSLSDLMVARGLVNLDFADVRTVLANTGRAKFGTGEAAGAERARRAAMQALTDPLLDEDAAGARGLLVSIQGGDDLLLSELDEAARQVTDMADPDADIVWGSSHDPSLRGRIRVSIIAAGIRGRAEGAISPAAAAPPPVESLPPPEPEPCEIEPEAEPEPAPQASPVSLDRPSPPRDSLFERMAGAARAEAAAAEAARRPSERRRAA